LYEIISPQDWGLPLAGTGRLADLLGVSLKELEDRCRRNTYEWLPRHFSRKKGAFYGHYNAQTRRFSPPQLVNLIAPWQLMAAYDRYSDDSLLAKAAGVAEWLHQSPFVLSHPMSLGIGGVREDESGAIWTKFTAEYVLLNLGLYSRYHRESRFLDRAVQSGRFLIQAARHDFAAKLTEEDAWLTDGWQAFGRAVEALLSLFEMTEEQIWRSYALSFGEHALSQQGDDGGFYLVNADVFNSDLAADPLRAMVFLFEETGENRYLRAARRFGDWLIHRQSEDGSWPINIDRDGNVVCPVVGPGDVPNIGIALLKIHQHTRDGRYLDAAIKTLRYLRLHPVR
jgi:hypothetical protein